MACFGFPVYGLDSVGLGGDSPAQDSLNTSEGTTLSSRKSRSGVGRAQFSLLLALP